jgi:hypothetical protein
LQEELIDEMSVPKDPSVAEERQWPQWFKVTTFKAPANTLKQVFLLQQGFMQPFLS